MCAVRRLGVQDKCLLNCAVWLTTVQGCLPADAVRHALVVWPRAEHCALVQRCRWRSGFQYWCVMKCISLFESKNPLRRLALLCVASAVVKV